jgi:hypothetical protein
MPSILMRTTLEMAINTAEMADRENGVAQAEYGSDLEEEGGRATGTMEEEECHEGDKEN